MNVEKRQQIIKDSLGKLEDEFYNSLGIPP